MDDGALVGILVPFTVFFFTAVVLVAVFYFNHKNRRTIYDAITSVAEKTGNVDAELVRAITNDKIGPNADLRRGVILIAIAGAFVLLGLLVGEQEAVGPMAGVAAFPGLVGIAYILFHFFAPRETVV
ncbi:MAG: hypothetical protein Tsb0010_10250 [Parvularculaceae bacterium]